MAPKILVLPKAKAKGKAKAKAKAVAQNLFGIVMAADSSRMEVTLNCQGGQTIIDVQSDATSLAFQGHHQYIRHEFHILPVVLPLGGKGLGKGAGAINHATWQVTAACDVIPGASPLLPAIPVIPVPPAPVHVPTSVNMTVSTVHSQMTMH
jgi:hypothetical protein